LGFLGIFSPGILLKLALLPLYNKWRRLRVARSALRGLNAAASGLVYTAVWQLFLGVFRLGRQHTALDADVFLHFLTVGYIYKPVDGATATGSASGPLTTDPWWGVVAASAFVTSQSFKVPPALSVLGGALAGLAWFGVVGVSGTERQPFV
jgi:chromate transport protein ChrA